MDLGIRRQAGTGRSCSQRLQYPGCLSSGKNVPPYPPSCPHLQRGARPRPCRPRAAGARPGAAPGALQAESRYKPRAPRRPATASPCAQMAGVAEAGVRPPAGSLPPGLGFSPPGGCGVPTPGTPAGATVPQGRILFSSAQTHSHSPWSLPPLRRGTNEAVIADAPKGSGADQTESVPHTPES